MFALIMFFVLLVGLGSIFLRAGMMTGQLVAWAFIGWALFTLYRVSQVGMGHGYNWPVALIVLAIAWMGRKWVTR